MDLRITENFNRLVSFDRIKVFKLDDKGMFTAIDEDGHRIISEIEPGMSIQLTEELPPDCYNCPAFR